MDKREFERGNPQEERPKRIAKRKKIKLLPLCLAVVAVMAVAALALLWDSTAFDGLRRSVIYARAEKDENGCALLYTYAAEKDNSYASLEGSLVLASPRRIALLGEDMAVRYSADVKFRQSAICSNGKVAAVYDIGGTEIYILSAQGLVRQLTAEGEILTCTLNDKGALAVTYNKSGYKAGVVVYSDKGELLFAFNSADRFLMTATVSRDGRQMAAVTMGQAEGDFASSVVIYRMESDTPHAVCELSGGAVYDLGTVGNTYCAVGEDALHFIGSNGALKAVYDFEGGYLRRCGLSDEGFAALVLGRYKSGSQARLVTVDDDGTVLGEVEVDHEVLNVSVAGKYVAVLYSDELVIYDKQLQPCARLTEVSAAKLVLMRQDGSAVLVGSGSASLYLP